MNAAQPRPIHEQEAELASLSPLEREVLAEYEVLLNNLTQLSDKLNDLSSAPTGKILESLRILERKTPVIFTALKASVYSIVLQNSMAAGEGGGGE